jgi:hypothetical protein
MKNNTPKVLIVVEGGIVQDVISDQPVQYFVKDFDLMQGGYAYHKPDADESLFDDASVFNGKEFKKAVYQDLKLS